jgi:glycosyltransferase involved in cell wall biosynthesis
MYTGKLYQALSERNRAVGSPHRFVVALSRGMPAPAFDDCDYLPAVKRPSRAQWVVDRHTLPGFLSRNKIEIFHATDFTSIPVSSSSRIIAHVHDMIPFIFWKQYAPRIPVDFRWALKQARRRMLKADRVITDSYASMRDIAEISGYPPDRIRVVYFGPAASDSAEIASGRPGKLSPYLNGLTSRPYFLYVGGTDFRKNVPFLIRAFSRFSEKHAEAGLLLVGETFRMRGIREVEEIYSEISRCGLEDRVHITGFVDEESLCALYRGALALVFPSLYEGFGVPVLESMALGTPVLAAQTSSIPEILGEAGLYFDPLEEDTLVDQLEVVYTGGALRERLRTQARLRAEQFSWEKAAEEVFRIYEELF